MLRLSHKEFQELLTKSAIQNHESLGYELYHTVYQSNFDEEVAVGSTHSTIIRDAFTFLRAEITFRQDTAIEMLSNVPQVGFCYILKARSTAYVNTSDQRESETAVNLTDLASMVYANSFSYGDQHYAGGHRFKAMYIHFTYESFAALIGDEIQSLPKELIDAISSPNGSYLSISSLHPSILSICEALDQNNFEGKSREFFVEAKVMELIALQINLLRLSTSKEKNHIVFTAAEKSKVIACYEELKNNLAQPPSIVQMSKDVGMSVYRLKDAFKELYGKSPFTLLTELRMSEAHRLLEQGEMNVSEVAARVGYSSLGSFSNAYREKYGVRPSILRKRN